MSVKSALIDISGTVLDSSSRPVPGAIVMLDELRAAGIQTVLMTNQLGLHFRARDAGLQADHYLSRAEVNANKGSRRWVAEARRRTGAGKHEIVLLGDTDQDMREAVNSGIPYFHAHWAVRDNIYGLRMLQPASFSLVLRECFTKREPWYATYEGIDDTGQTVNVVSMMDSRGGGDQHLEGLLRRFLKERIDGHSTPMPFGVFVAFHLLGSLFTSGLVADADIWTVYPGSKVNKGPNASLTPFMEEAARLFQDKFHRELLIRHTDAEDSGRTRANQGQVSMENQVGTVMVNPALEHAIQNKHVIVVDDFEQSGLSLEWARLLLLNAGVKRVTGVSVAKYAMRYQGIRRTVWTYSGTGIDPFRAVEFVPDDFSFQTVPLNTHGTASEFRDSYRRVFSLD